MRIEFEKIRERVPGADVWYVTLRNEKGEVSVREIKTVSGRGSTVRDVETYVRAKGLGLIEKIEVERCRIQ